MITTIPTAEMELACERGSAHNRIQKAAILPPGKAVARIITRGDNYLVCARCAGEIVAYERDRGNEAYDALPEALCTLAPGAVLYRETLNEELRKSRAGRA